MLGGEHRRSKVYASCLEVLRKLPTCSFTFRCLKTKTRFADVFKARKEEITYRKGIYRLKRKKPLTSHKYPA